MTLEKKKNLLMLDYDSRRVSLLKIAALGFYIKFVNACRFVKFSHVLRFESFGVPSLVLAQTSSLIQFWKRKAVKMET